jgi:hypothetical protein
MSAVDVPISVLRDRIELQSLELESAIHGLCAATRSAVSPSHWIRERPLVCLTGALAIGWWLGSGGRGIGRRAWR